MHGKKKESGDREGNESKGGCNEKKVKTTKKESEGKVRGMEGRKRD